MRPVQLVPTKAVIIRANGARAIIRAVDFNPALHALQDAPAGAETAGNLGTAAGDDDAATGHLAAPVAAPGIKAMLHGDEQVITRTQGASLATQVKRRKGRR